MKNTPTTTQNTDLVLKKSKSTLNITKRILSGSKSLTTKSNKEVILNPDVMMINGLMWQKESQAMTWYDAMEYAKNLRLGGYDNWRLPTIEELEKIIRYCGGKSCNIITQKGKDCYEIRAYNNDKPSYHSSYEKEGFNDDICYWSSSESKTHFNFAYMIYFYHGYISDQSKDYDYGIRCVRTVK